MPHGRGARRVSQFRSNHNSAQSMPERPPAPRPPVAGTTTATVKLTCTVTVTVIIIIIIVVIIVILIILIIIIIFFGMTVNVIDSSSPGSCGAFFVYAVAVRVVGRIIGLESDMVLHSLDSRMFFFFVPVQGVCV